MTFSLHLKQLTKTIFPTKQFVATLCTSIAAINLVGCDSNNAESQNILTSGIRADIAVLADGLGSTDISAIVYVGTSNTLVNLEGDDDLFATHDGSTQRLNENQGNFGLVSYSTTFVNVEDGSFTVALNRSVEQSANNSTVTLPESFNITAPTTNQQVTGSVPIEFSWSSAGFSDELTLGYVYNCGEGNQTGTLPIQDTGSVSLTATQISTDLGEKISNGNTCLFDATFTRTNEGSADSLLHPDSQINAYQRRTVSFSLLGS